MADKNGTWLIVVIVIIAGILIAFSFTQNKPGQMPAPVVTRIPVNNIKADHSPDDMKKIAAVKPVSAIVEMPKAVFVKQAFAVQVYSFKDKKRADAALKTLKEKGYPAYVMMSDLGPRGVFYRVRVGSFASEDEAKKNLESVTKDFKSGIIVAE